LALFSLGLNISADVTRVHVDDRCEAMLLAPFARRLASGAFADAPLFALE
jgi:hypothetical protein